MDYTKLNLYKVRWGGGGEEDTRILSLKFHTYVICYGVLDFCQVNQRVCHLLTDCLLDLWKQTANSVSADVIENTKTKTIIIKNETIQNFFCSHQQILHTQLNLQIKTSSFQSFHEILATNTKIILIKHTPQTRTQTGSNNKIPSEHMNQCSAQSFLTFFILLGTFWENIHAVDADSISVKIVGLEKASPKFALWKTVWDTLGMFLLHWNTTKQNKFEAGLFTVTRYTKCWSLCWNMTKK